MAEYLPAGRQGISESRPAQCGTAQRDRRTRGRRNRGQIELLSLDHNHKLQTILKIADIIFRTRVQYCEYHISLHDQQILF